MNQKIEQYLNRIQFTDPIIHTQQLLDKLQTQHVYTIPYENMDILENKPLSYNQDDLFEKIITNRRGGYCFELNGLYGWLLRKLGFTVHDYMARFLLGEPEIPMRRHRVLIVELNGQKILCDVGVGIEVPRQTITLTPGILQEQPFGIYRIEHEPFFGWVLYEQYKGEWQKLYSFTEEPQLPIDYIMPSFYCEKHPDSIFNKEPMVAIKTPDGRKTLDGNIFKVHTAKGVSIQEPQTKEEFYRLLEEYFGISIQSK